MGCVHFPLWALDEAHGDSAMLAKEHGCPLCQVAVSGRLNVLERLMGRP